MIYLLSVFLLVGILLVGCGDDDKEGEIQPERPIEISDLAGSWVIQQYKATSPDDPETSVELISLGVAFQFEADEDGAFEGRGFAPALFAGMTVELPFQGNVQLISQDSLLVSFTPEQPPFLTNIRGAFSLEGNTLALIDSNSTFDFDGNQELEPAIFEGALVKNDGSYPAIVFTEDFEGLWEATSYTVTSDPNPPNPQISIDTIAEGATFVFDVNVTGEAIGTAFIPAAFAGQDTTFADFEASFELIYQDEMIIAFNPEEPPFLTNTQGSFSLVGNTFTLTDENALFDFDGDQVPEPADAVVVMERTSTSQ
jgi:hypothetical protein